jgi:hypothetical protein
MQQAQKGVDPMLRLITLVAAVSAALALTLPAEASAPPVGRLPKGPVTLVRTPAGTLVSLALPQLKGLSWRLARQVDSRVVVETGEGVIGTSVVITFRAKAAGHTKVIYAATRGESTVARAARTLDVTVTR